MLTTRQQQVLDLIRENIEQSGLPPTRAEIADRLGFRSINAAVDHLKALARKGAIELLPGSSRGIRLLDSTVEEVVRASSGIPLVGRVAAGNPVLAAEQIEGRYQVDPQLFARPVDYLLRVHGMSMRDAGILDGDLLAVHKQSTAMAGEIVVARIDDEVTVKRFRRQGSQVQLLPENPEFEPIDIDLQRESFSIEGISVGVIRSNHRR